MNATKAEVTDVLFRVDDTGTCFALFPGHAGTGQPGTCSCFDVMGGHSSADLAGCIQRSRPATPEEYKRVKRILEAAPYKYKLRVMQRSTQTHYHARLAQLYK